MLGLSLAGCGDSDGGGTGGSEEAVITRCEGATPILQASGEDSGYATCPDGSVFRDEPATCDTNVPACQGDEQWSDCASDTDCSAKPGGKCGRSVSYEGDTIAGCTCLYPCATDADCDADQACLCGGIANGDPESPETWSRCVYATCRTAGDCPSQECGVSTSDTGCGASGELMCRSATDGCRTEEDCEKSLVCGKGESGWECDTRHCQ